MHDNKGFEDRINALMGGLTKAQLARRVVEMERHNDPAFRCATDVLVQLERTSDAMRRAGVCPECLTVPEVSMPGMGYACSCGQCIDYGPLQAIEHDVSANDAKRALERFKAELEDMP